ncbi:MAG TPA: hypothetical protein VHP83_18215 [Aggregatilineaceae bacterium]|nr:hypothetical protein [Aggregatilineaceae bacterium]
MNRYVHPLSSRTGLMILIVLLIGAYGIRIWNLNTPSIWHDEAWSIRAIRDPIHTPDDNTPPVYYSLIHFLWLGAGETPFALRYGSVLLDLITITLATMLIRRWAGWELGLVAGVLLAASPLLWAYAREIRAYASVPLLTLVLLGLAERILHETQHAAIRWRTGMMVLAAELGLLYTHNLSVPVIGWLNLTVGTVLLYRRQWQNLGFWVGGQVVALVAYLPWVLNQNPSGTPLNSPPALNPTLVWDIWQGYFAPLPSLVGADNALMITSALFGLVAMVSAGILLAETRQRAALLVVSQAVIIPALATVELLAARIDFHPRYYIAGVPAALMAVALAVNHLPLELRRLAIPGALALACGSAGASLPELLDNPKYQHDDFQAVARYYATLPEDAVIFIPYGWEPALDVYYADKLDIRAEMVEIDLHSGLQTAIQEMNAALEKRFELREGPVWVELLDWYQLPADWRGMYPCLLESAGRQANNGFVVQGIGTQGYWVERPVALVEINKTRGDYGPLTLQTTAGGGSRAVCVHTAWTLRQPVYDDWRVSGRLLTTDPPGETIVSRDSDIRRDDQASTSDWEVGDQGDAFSLLRLPDGMPPGEYQVGIAVYNPQQPKAQVHPLGTVELDGTTQIDIFQGKIAVPVDIPVSDGIELIGHDAQGGVLNPGQKLRIILYWRREGACCEAWTDTSLVLRGENGSVFGEQPVKVFSVYSQDWHIFTIPAEASGPATLVLEAENTEPIVLAAYNIEKSEHLFAAPAFDVAVGAEFEGVGVLEGFRIAATTVTRPDMLELTLVWRASATTDVPLVAFAHLLGTDGQVIAQDDQQPLEGLRPTTSWVAGEYLIDTYALAFKPDIDYQGQAQIEVGLYYPDDWTKRIPLVEGGDHVILPLEITVQ